MSTSDEAHLSPQELLRHIAGDASSLPYDNETARYRVNARAEMLLRRMFGLGHRYLDELSKLRFYPLYDSTRAVKQKQWREAANALAELLTTAAEELDLFGAMAGTDHGTVEGPMPTGRKVFVVHGHDDGLKNTVARVLTRLDLTPIILHEEPNRGRTIIEKFEDYAEVAFAVVLLTADDMGFEASKGAKATRPRARQNVILELGFFLGKLSRSRVVALHTLVEGFELPTDYSGVLFVPVDAERKWEMDLVRELKAVGIEVDANKLFAQ